MCHGVECGRLSEDCVCFLLAWLVTSVAAQRTISQYGPITHRETTDWLSHLAIIGRLSTNKRCRLKA